MSDSAGIRIVKRKKGHASHHGGAWKVAYADFVTAMMAFFLVMWIVGLSQNIKEAVAGYFKDPVAFMKAAEGGKAPFATMLKDKAAASPTPSPQQDSAERAGLEKAKKTIEQMVAGTPEFKNLKQYVDIKLTDEGLKIDLLEAKGSLFFDSASAKIKPSTKKLLSKLTAELRKLPNKVIIEGHTDSRPLNRTDGYTNWELSADRANSARHVMETAGMRADQIAQVRGLAATQPRDPAHPEHFSNRRVSIVVMTSDAMKRQQLGASGPADIPTVSPGMSPGLSKPAH